MRALQACCTCHPHTRFAPFLRLTGALVPYRGTNIPVTVEFKSDLRSNRFWFDRQFSINPDKPFRFLSYMEVIRENILVEFMRFNTGWRIRYEVDGDKVHLKHAGYVWRVFGVLIPLPLSLIIVVCDTREWPISDDEFAMSMTLNHKLFGEIYKYQGRFKIVSKRLYMAD